jgi:acetyltransferase-like isoleucine patch superfamily enzyme
MVTELERERRAIRIDVIDPLRRHQEQAEAVREVLESACNEIGHDVIVEDGVVLIGGSFPGGVGLRLADGVRIYSGCHLVIDQIDAESGISVGSGASLNYGCYIEGSGGVTIGERTILGPNVVILSSTHRMASDIEVTRSGKEFKSTTVGDDVWVGANVVIIGGITIGDGAVVGAGSIVTREVLSHVVVAGNPAREIRSVERWQP